MNGSERGTRNYKPLEGLVDQHVALTAGFVGSITPTVLKASRGGGLTGYFANIPETEAIIAIFDSLGGWQIRVVRSKQGIVKMSDDEKIRIIRELDAQRRSVNHIQPGFPSNQVSFGIQQAVRDAHRRFPISSSETR